jgi:hypothetical protein
MKLTGIRKGAGTAIMGLGAYASTPVNRREQYPITTNVTTGKPENQGGAMNVTDVELNQEEQKVPDMLVALFERQKALEDKYYPIEASNGALCPPLPLDLDTFQGQERMRSVIHRIAAEIYEADNCLRNKAWKSTHVPTDKEHFWEEMIDGLHFYLQAFIEGGISAEDVFNLYTKKNKVNQFRQRSNY